MPISSSSSNSSSSSRRELDNNSSVIQNGESPSSQSPSLRIMSLEDKFKAAVKVIHSLPKDGPYQPSTGTKLKFYGLFKQATEGPNNVPRPAFWDVVGKYKWEAWKELGQLSKDTAMLKYIDSLKEIVETMSWDGNVQDFLNTIGPFYEFVNLQGSEMSHVKETIDRLTSSSGSDSSSGSGSGSGSGGSSSNSSTSSIVPSPANSALNSPQKSCNDSSSTGGSTTIENEGEGDEAEVQLLVESRTATFEMNPYAKINGNNKMNGHHQHPFPPPTPQHTYSRKSSLVNQPSNGFNGSVAEQEEQEARNDEVIGVTLPNSNGVNGGPAATCQEDLEENDPPQEPVMIRMMMENNTLSGTEESEKYYSGDSEPEEDGSDFPDNQQGTFKGYSSIQTQQQKQSHLEETQKEIPSTSTSINNQHFLPVITTLPPPSAPCPNCANMSTNSRPSYSSNSNHRGTNSNSSTTTVVSRNRKSSPKQHQQQQNNTGCVGLNGIVPYSCPPEDAILSSTVERLNRDVDHIVARLRILETAYAASVGDGRLRRKPFFGGLSPSAITFLIMWPFACAFLVKMMSWWWARRKRGILALARKSLR